MSRRDPQGLGFDPEMLRALVDAYDRLLAAAEQLRSESTSLPELLAVAGVVDEVAGKRASCLRRLDRIECQRHTQARSAALAQAGTP